MVTFNEAADDFIARDKAVAGLPKFERSQLNDGYNLVWLLEDVFGTGPNRINIKTFDGVPHSFIIMVDMFWPACDRLIPVFRLMMVPPKEPHRNMPPLPPNIIDLSVIGPRYYSWENNRNSFKVSLPGLPYANPLPRNLEDFHNSIRFACGECNIDLSNADLPDFPGKGRLF